MIRKKCFHSQQSNEIFAKDLVDIKINSIKITLSQSINL